MLGLTSSLPVYGGTCAQVLPEDIEKLTTNMGVCLFRLLELNQLFVSEYAA
jgi:hypothetical protein